MTKKKLGFSDILSGLKGYKLSLFSKKNLELNLKNDVAGTNYLLDSIKRKKTTQKFSGLLYKRNNRSGIWFWGFFNIST